MGSHLVGCGQRGEVGSRGDPGPVRLPPRHLGKRRRWGGGQGASISAGNWWVAHGLPLPQSVPLPPPSPQCHSGDPLLRGPADLSIFICFHTCGQWQKPLLYFLSRSHRSSVMTASLYLMPSAANVRALLNTAHTGGEQGSKARVGGWGA